MRTTWTAEKCLQRACRLMIMADEANDYKQILTYDGLAQQWVEMAALASRVRDTEAAQGASSPRRRFIWREFRAWFR